MIKWVGDSWREINIDIGINSFKKAGLIDTEIEIDIKDDVGVVLKDLDDFETDDPYLDDLELEITYLSQLKFIDE